jgi:hypothetical protein
VGAGNRRQMAPAAKRGSFGCRSSQYTGVYRSKRANVRWRTQFSWNKKVVDGWVVGWLVEWLGGWLVGRACRRAPLSRLEAASLQRGVCCVPHP